MWSCGCLLQDRLVLMSCDRGSSLSYDLLAGYLHSCFRVFGPDCALHTAAACVISVLEQQGLTSSGLKTLK